MIGPAAKMIESAPEIHNKCKRARDSTPRPYQASSRGRYTSSSAATLFMITFGWNNEKYYRRLSWTILVVIGLITADIFLLPANSRQEVVAKKEAVLNQPAPLSSTTYHLVTSAGDQYKVSAAIFNKLQAGDSIQVERTMLLRRAIGLHWCKWNNPCDQGKMGTFYTGYFIYVFMSILAIYALLVIKGFYIAYSRKTQGTLIELSLVGMLALIYYLFS